MMKKEIVLKMLNTMINSLTRDLVDGLVLFHEQGEKFVGNPHSAKKGKIHSVFPNNTNKYYLWYERNKKDNSIIFGLGWDDYMRIRIKVKSLYSNLWELSFLMNGKEEGEILEFVKYNLPGKMAVKLDDRYIMELESDEYLSALDIWFNLANYLAEFSMKNDLFKFSNKGGK